MKPLEVSGAVRLIYMSLSVKGLKQQERDVGNQPLSTAEFVYV